MVVTAINQSYSDICLGKNSCGVKSSEARANYNNVRNRILHLRISTPDR